ncbi:GrgA family transcription factor [Candidatus Chlamydia sanziniae]|uniref:Uncharacterized protein n=1 Tax=Candidatus Chlamydia sanziniae TaxID=1806891 RepID=A0A1A9HWK4_9CHLA|nr:hypothetical protein [Candidatus Chlamydia sanziniae]ANH78424.1 hypothetical protein Cs308_0253 [Candidatus Chlamydia sanziniae]
MYFTRDPVIETVITSREGYKLSVRNTKHFSQDPFIVEAIEVISLGSICFFRNCDHSKPFIVPAGDYEVMEIRDTKINLKAIGLDRSVKIAGGREALIKLTKSTTIPTTVPDEKPAQDVSEECTEVVSSSAKKEKKEIRNSKESFKGDKWKEKKKQGRRRTHKEIAEITGASQEILDTVTEELWEEAQEAELNEQKKFSLLPPPTKLISEVISQVVVDPEITSADLEESLQALVKESSEVINVLLSGDDVVLFPEEETGQASSCSLEKVDISSQNSFSSEEEF